MWNFSGYVLDEYHAVSQCFDEEAQQNKWVLFTFHDKFQSEQLTKGLDGKLWTMEIINADDFLWNDKSVKLIVEDYELKNIQSE